jgi:hypothetical protein
MNVFFFEGLQNTGVAIFFLRLSLPQPDSDLAIVVPIFVCTLIDFFSFHLSYFKVAIAIPIPLLIIYAILSIYRRYKKRDENNSLVTNVDVEHDRTQYEQLPINDNEQ